VNSTHPETYTYSRIDILAANRPKLLSFFQDIPPGENASPRWTRSELLLKAPLVKLLSPFHYEALNRYAEKCAI
jgi:hypothetical protein